MAVRRENTRLGGGTVVCTVYKVSLLNALRTRGLGENTLPTELNALVPALITRFNSEVAPRLLSRLPSEELPTSPLAASSFRARVSLLVEYSLIEMLADFLTDDAPELHVTFNTTNEFADCYVRDEAWNIELRVDMKTLHDASAEASARFTEPTPLIRELDDYLMYVTWQWQTLAYLNVEVIIPAILDSVFIPAIEIAEERDRRQILAGGSFDRKGIPLAASGIRDTNFGKLNRIIHSERRGAGDLSPRLRKLLRMMEVQAEARASIPAPMVVVEELADAAGGVVTDAIDEA